MSLEKHLNSACASLDASDENCYIKAITKAFNAYMKDLEADLSNPTQYLDGTAITPSGETIPVKGTVAYFIPNKLRFTEAEVKAAMWCSKPNLAFINLFTLFGEKFTANFTTLEAKPTLFTGKAITVTNTAHFPINGTALMTWAAAEGASGTLDHTKFEKKFSELLLAAIHAIPPFIAPVIGGTCAAGTFTGFIGVEYASAR